MTFGSLFSGIGGMDLGLERAGMTCRWQVEIDPFCQGVLAKHWPEVKRYGDIRELYGSELEPVDLICGGFPCQPTSKAGRQLGADDHRWLWPEYYRIIRAVLPRFVLVENPTGILDWAIGRVLGDLAEIGFDAEWETVAAGRFDMPHQRERVFIFAWRDWEPVVWADECELCDCCGEPWCAKCGDHYATCGCPGPCVDIEDGWYVFDEPWGLVAYPFPPRLQGYKRRIMEGKQYVSGYLAGRDSARPWFAPRKDGASQSWILRTVHGVPGRVDRIGSLGNAVVPQVAEWIGRRIMECQ